ncbi:MULTISPECIES: hypothetical protein [unclassified Shinella]|uniref:hypothetical protein n=1 Tax=unclassified Shinella TaxID=2643062 RepID=UPI00225D1B23|nr:MULTISPECIES: hypothetical protein [unclassified Shinella]MCO5153699.1 hypothetical protein [Shinella sp.]MDC7259955.1 hypothetical protein [Shinella sp. YE25]CAI0341687.1 conserved hypothetical protein [Rhizobiaceae bacterium]
MAVSALLGEKEVDVDSAIFSSLTERAAWRIATRHLGCGQRDPVKMIVDAIEQERARCIGLIEAAGFSSKDLSPFIADPHADW